MKNLFNKQIKNLRNDTHGYCFLGCSGCFGSCAHACFNVCSNCQITCTANCVGGTKH